MSEGAMGSPERQSRERWIIISIMEKQEALLKEWEPLPGRISKLLEAGRITDAHERHYLAFVEMEVSTIVASLRMPLAPPPRDRCVVDLIDRHKSWLMMLKHETRDAIDMVKLLCKRHREEAPRSLLRKPMRCFRRPMSFNYETPGKAYHLYRVCSNDPRLKLPRSELMPSLHQAAQVEAAAVRHDHLVGIDGTANELLGWLMAADKSLRVMAIAGPASIGKTTLAMELHRRLRCQTHFQCHIVANFSGRPHRSKLLPQTILKQIIEQLEAPSSPNSSEITKQIIEQLDDLELLARNISERLKDKRYFALIDDIFDESDWEMIKGAFSNNNCGSRILFTARDERIAGWCLSNYNGIVHKMKPLNDSDSEKLLRTKAFSSMDGCLPDNLRLLCDEILNMCRGIPLFITSMADWLKQHQQQYGSSAVPRVEQVRLLLKQFEHWLSFDYSDGLRQSSLYLSMFPQGYVFENKDHLMKGFIPEWDRSPDFGKRNFSWLLNRKIIIPAAENCGLNIDEDDLCQWQGNPFILRVLASRAAEMGLVFTSSTLTSAPSGGGNTTRIARRLALHHPDPQLPAMLQQMDLSQTRSLLISGAVDRTTVALDKFGYLVLLDLEGWENLKDEDLLQICKMFMLRYLSVRNTKVSKLAPQIKELRILRTLDISRTNISEIPSEVCDLNYLEMLDLRGTRIRHIPEKVKQLTSLKRLDISHTKISEIPSERHKDKTSSRESQATD
uniref:Uncharacterized protein n=1 Tax=Oryza meridionalis TaxID=40149 RepID=A0A0E0DXJ6_9ORYZ